LLGDQLVARNAGELFPDFVSDPSAVTPTSNVQVTLAAPTPHDLAEEAKENEEGTATPEFIGPPVPPNDENTVATEEAPPVETPAVSSDSATTSAPPVAPAVASTATPVLALEAFRVSADQAAASIQPPSPRHP
jgi:hypothetical protein